MLKTSFTTTAGSAPHLAFGGLWKNLQVCLATIVDPRGPKSVILVPMTLAEEAGLKPSADRIRKGVNSLGHQI
jgi:hypothetical protein